MILRIRVGHPDDDISVCSSDILRCSSDVILRKHEGVYAVDDKGNEVKNSFGWIAWYSFYIFGEGTRTVTVHIAQNVEESVARRSDKFLEILEQHEAILKAMNR